MASSSGKSSGSGNTCSVPGSEEVGQMMDARKRKRMLSNRESARRSRMRKQKHLDDLTDQLSQLRKQNNQILSTINLTTQQSIEVEAENSILRVHVSELSQRLQALNEILSYVNTASTTNNEVFDVQDDVSGYGFIVNDPWNDHFHFLNQQPIMASADMFQY